MGILLKIAIPLETETVISSIIEKIKELLPKLPVDVATGPLLSVKDTGEGVTLVTFTKKLIVALADFLDFGKYPMFLAIETTFSLNVALSRKTSFATILALYEVIYVLYAKTSSIDDRLEPSKS